MTHDRRGATCQRLSSDIAYIKLSSIKASDVASYVDPAAGTKGLILDIRNYPSAFVVFTLGQLLVTRPITAFARFTGGDLTNPGAFHWTPSVTLNAQRPHYAGKVAILVDEVTQSQAEYTTMAFRTAPGAKVIGSTTADGDVSWIPLPGGLISMISGLGVFYPDKRPTQRIGIVPDIDVKPTIAGIRAQRDEVLEAAWKYLGGSGPIPKEIEPVVRVLRPESMPASWTSTGTASAYRVGMDAHVAHTGGASGHITAQGNAAMGLLEQSIRADEYRGKRIRFTAYVRTRGIGEIAGSGAKLVMRLEDADGSYTLDTRAYMQITEDVDWTKLRVALDVPQTAVGIRLGLMFLGLGEAWIDDASLDIVGADVPVSGMPPTPVSPSLAATFVERYRSIPTKPANLGFEQRN